MLFTVPLLQMLTLSQMQVQSELRGKLSQSSTNLIIASSITAVEVEGEFTVLIKTYMLFFHWALETGS